MKSWVQLNYIQHFVIVYKQRRQKSFICEEKQQMCRSYFLRGGALCTKTKVSFKNYNRFAVRKVPEQLLKILNGMKLILDDQGKQLDSYTISLKSFRSFRVPLFNKPVTAQELFLLFLTDWNRVFPYHVYVIFLFFFSSLQTNTICDTIYTKECSFSNKTTCTTSYENECKTTTENKCTIVYDEKCSAVYEDKCQTGKISALTFKFVLKVK